MEPEILYAKMESLNRCILRIEEKKPENIFSLKDDLDLQDIIVINLERAVQQSVDAGLHILIDYGQSRVDSMADVFLALKQNKIIGEKLSKNLIGAVGFRNIAVHEYRSLNWDVVWSIIENNLQDFKDFQKAVLKLIN